MTEISWLPLVSLSILTLLVGCGGGGDSDSALPAGSYAFVTPASGSQQIYALTTTDNSNNTIHQTVRDSVTHVDADGSYNLVQDDPTGDSLTVNGTSYAIPTETVSLSNTGGTESYSYIPAGTTASITCVYATSGGTAGYPHALGQSWNLTYTVNCGTSISPLFTQVGGVDDVESVTVPAGSFTALKLQSTVTWTNATGTTRTEFITSWRDSQTSLLLKRVINYAYSGTQLTNGYPVTVIMELQSKT